MNPRISSCHVFIWRYKSSKELSEGCNSAISGFPLFRHSRRVISRCVYACTHPYTCMHTHREQKTRKHGFKKPKYDINKAEGAELGNAKPHANRLCIHPFVKTDLWIVYHIFKAIFWSYFITLSQNCLIKVPITISCTTKLWYVKLQTRKHWNHKFLQY